METTENIIDESNELKVLRKQILELREALTHSKITNENIIRRSMGKRSSWLEIFVKAEAYSLPFLTLVLLIPSLLFGSSVYPVIVYFLLATVSVWLDWHTMRIASHNILTMSLSELRVSLVKQKKLRLVQTLVETPITILWLLWYLSSLKSSFNHEDELTGIIDKGVSLGFFVGVIIAIIVIFLIYHKAQKTNNDLIETIDLEKES